MDRGAKLLLGIFAGERLDALTGRIRRRMKAHVGADRSMCFDEPQQARWHHIESDEQQVFGGQIPAENRGSEARWEFRFGDPACGPGGADEGIRPVAKQSMVLVVADRLERTREFPIVKQPPRIRECPIQLEATLEHVRPIARRDPRLAVAALELELRVQRVHVEESLLVADDSSRIDPERWRPLLMSFRQFYARGPQLRPSRLAAAGPESRYAPAGRQLTAALQQWNSAPPRTD